MDNGIAGQSEDAYLQAEKNVLSLSRRTKKVKSKPLQLGNPKNIESEIFCIYDASSFSKCNNSIQYVYKFIYTFVLVIRPSFLRIPFLRAHTL